MCHMGVPSPLNFRVGGYAVCLCHTVPSILHLGSGGPCWGKGVWREMFYPGWHYFVSWWHLAPSTLPVLSWLRTFCFASVVCLHEVSGTAAEVAALGIVAELRAGAEAQALIDVWGYTEGSWGVW